MFLLGECSFNWQKELDFEGSNLMQANLAPSPRRSPPSHYDMQTKKYDNFINLKLRNQQNTTIVVNVPPMRNET